MITLAVFAFFSTAVVMGSLALGMAGFHWLENLSWLDSLLNASMLLGGMGPVTTPVSDAGKYFASHSFNRLCTRTLPSANMK